MSNPTANSAQKITTVQQLDALGHGVLIRTDAGEMFRRVCRVGWEPYWEILGVDYDNMAFNYDSSQIQLPATLLWGQP